MLRHAEFLRVKFVDGRLDEVAAPLILLIGRLGGWGRRGGGVWGGGVWGCQCVLYMDVGSVVTCSACVRESCEKASPEGRVLSLMADNRLTPHGSKCCRHRSSRAETTYNNRMIKYCYTNIDNINLSRSTVKLFKYTTREPAKETVAHCL